MDEPESSASTGSHFVAKDAAALAAETKQPVAPGRRRHRRRFSQKLRTQYAIHRAWVILAIVAVSVAIVALSLFLGSKSSEFRMDAPGRAGRR
jgi:hypothetical protein